MRAWLLNSHQTPAAALGYNQQLWDNDQEPDECDEDWKDLTPAQQQAATALGYTKKSWDKSWREEEKPIVTIV